MVDKVKELLNKVLEWWNKFTSKQKTIIIGTAAVTVFAFAILIWVFSQKPYAELRVCENTKEASEVIDLLTSANINYETSTDGLIIRVEESQLGPARLVLGAAGIPSVGMTIDDVTSGGFSVTEADKQKRLTAYNEDALESMLESMDAVKSAKIKLDEPEKDGTLIASEQEASAAIFLELSGDFTEENAAYVARAIATALGNKTTNGITIIDTSSGKLLFSGTSEMSIGGIASSQLTVRQQQEGLITNSVKKVLLGTEQFNAIEVACNLDIDFSSKEIVKHSYGAQDGREEGLLAERSEYNSESSGANGGLPGTDSNTEEGTTYQYSDYANQNSTESEIYEKHVLDEEIETAQEPSGKVNYANSSISLTAISYNVIKEEDARRQGLLEGLSWDEYKAANSEPQRLPVDEDLYSMVSNATGIPEERITIIANSRNEFIDSESLVGWTDVVSVVLILLILALLGFVVLRSMQVKKEENGEEELSVEALLQSTPEEVNDIELENKSETRKMIEKFVDDNPEAAANLLRNWLNEDWG